MSTPNTNLDEIIEHQASKYLTHNSALRDIDVLLQPIVENKTQITPPTPVDGKLYIVSSGAGGFWQGHDNHLAYGISGAWKFIAPKTDWIVYVRDEGKHYRFDGTNWIAQASGDLVGTGNSTDQAWPRFKGTNGKELQNGRWVENNNGDVTAGGHLSMNNQTIIKPAIRHYTEVTHDLGNLTGTVNIDFEKGNFQYGRLIGDVTFTFTNPPPTGRMAALTLELTQGTTGNHVVTWPAHVQFSGGIPPTLSTQTDALDIVVLYTHNGGANYRLGVVGLDFL